MDLLTGFLKKITCCCCNMFTLVIIGGTLSSIDNFLFTLFYAVILTKTLNFQFSTMRCCADDATGVRRMLDEN